MTLCYRDRGLFLKSIVGLKIAILAKKTFQKSKLLIFAIFVASEPVINVCIKQGISDCKKAKFAKLAIISS